MFGRKRCSVCHSWMRRFKNPDRYICPDERTHEAILKAKADAEKKKAEGRARGRQTQARRGPSKKQREQGKKVGKAFGGANKKPRRKRRTMDPGTGFVARERAREQGKKRNQPRDPKTGKFIKRKKNGK